MHAMAADLEDRYESATQMLQDLDEFRKNPAITFRFDGEPEAPRPQERAGQPRSAAERAVRGKSDTSRRHPVQPQKKRRGNAVALITGFIVIALALAGIGFFLYSFFFADFLTSTDDVPVPNLVGLYAEDIQQSDYPNFQIRVEDWVPDDTVEQGRVISQTPVADRLVKSGTTISLTVSSGPSTDTMRDLLNDTLENAQTILDNLALDLQVKVEYESSDLGEGTVIRTDPVKGTALTAGQTVTLYVSSGPAVKLVPVPELVGLTEEQAIEKLESRNLKYEITRLDREEALGTVVFQSIKQGEEVKEGTTVNLQVSNGPEKDPLDPDADEEDDENTEGNEPPQMLQDRLIYIKLPSGLTEELEITVKMDDVTIDSWTLDPETLNDQNETSIMLSGVGIHRIDVYIDGLLYYTMDYDFDTGEELS